MKNGTCVYVSATLTSVVFDDNGKVGSTTFNCQQLLLPQPISFPGSRNKLPKINDHFCIAFNFRSWKIAEQMLRLRIRASMGI